MDQVIFVSPPGYAHSGALAELAETLQHGLRQAGSDRTVVVGAHLLRPTDPPLPLGAAVYNTEHVCSSWMTEHYRERLRACCEIWDYNATNATAMSELLNKPVRHVPLGFVAELERIGPAPDQDIDVLFYGSLNDRRQAILDQLAAAGLTVDHVFGVYGAKRDALIARAKVVLNMHFYQPGQFEVVRAAYLLANRKCVVSELNPGEEMDVDLRDALVGVPYDDLVPACFECVKNDALRKLCEKTGFEAFAARDMGQILRSTLGGMPAT